MIKKYAISGTVLALVFISLLMGAETRCGAKWEDFQYSIFSGCLVNVNGVYTPEQNVRVIKWEYVE